MKFYYVYILISESKVHYYTGFTTDIHARLKEHNYGHCPHTAKYKPWIIKNAFAFRDKDKAINFELYLKSPSGRAFAKKHF